MTEQDAPQGQVGPPPEDAETVTPDADEPEDEEVDEDAAANEAELEEGPEKQDQQTG